MQLGWIDFSKQDRANAINIIDSMKEKGVLDELGFGSLRQAFADFFFPGTSTIQTRAKYFFIVPYILQDYIFHQQLLVKMISRNFLQIRRIKSADVAAKKIKLEKLLLKILVMMKTLA